MIPSDEQAQITPTTEEETPLCPHCDRELNELKFKEFSGKGRSFYLLFCPHCRKVLKILKA